MGDGNDPDYQRGKVRQACQNWQILEDEGFAYSLQNKEISEHYDRNRENSRLLRDDFQAARLEQTTEQEMLECTRQQEEAEAEELASQLALLLDEERQEEDAIRLDEQLARKLAQEDDEAIAREQQDRELARMLQAKERIKAKKLREARRRRDEAVATTSHAVDAEKNSSEQSEEVLYANLDTPFKAPECSRAQNREYSSVAQNSESQQATTLPDGLHQSSIYLLRNSDIISSAVNANTLAIHGTTTCSERPNTTNRPSYLYNASKSEDRSEVLGAPNHKPGNRNVPPLARSAIQNEGPIPPYMPMQGISERAVPSSRMSRPSPPSTMNLTSETASKKSSSCKTQ